MIKINIEKHPFLYFLLIELKEKYFNTLFNKIVHSSIILMYLSVIYNPFKALYFFHKNIPILIILLFCYIIMFSAFVNFIYFTHLQVRIRIQKHRNQLNIEFNHQNNFLLWYYLEHKTLIKYGFKEEFSDNILRHINKLNLQDMNGDTLLHLMIKDNHKSPYISELLLLGADPYIKNNKNISAIDLMPEERKILFVKNDEKQVAHILNSNELESPVKKKRRL